MDDLEFSDLIEKYQKGLLSREQKKLVDEWFDSMGNEKIQDAWIEKDQLRLKNKILSEIRDDKKSISPSHKRSILNVRFRGVYRIAASITLLAIFTYLIWQYASVKPLEVVTLQTTTSENINKIILTDGTLVWLKGNSTLTYPSGFSSSTRRVSLQGEALFEVAKDPKHPFIIQCGDLITTVLGTSFNIKSTKENIEVVVLTGKVSLTSVTDKQGVIVLPNEKAIYNGKHKQLAKEVTISEEKESAVTGTAYSMNFEDTQMKEIITRIEGKFDVQVSTSDPKLGNCMITADFTDQSLDRTLNMISQALGLDYEIKDKTIILRGAGCN